MLKFQLGKKAMVGFFPIIGTAYYQRKSLQDSGDFQDYTRDLIARNPEIKIILTNFLIYPVVVVTSPEYFKYLTQNHDQFDIFVFLFDNRLIKKGLLGAQGKKWRDQRKLLSKSFHYDELAKRVPWINQLMIKKVSNWKEGNFDPVFEISAITGVNLIIHLKFLIKEIVIQTFFGDQIERKELNGKLVQTEIIESIGELTSTTRNLYFLLKKILFGQKAWTILPSKQEKQVYDRITQIIEFSEQVIEERIRDINDKKRQDQIPDFLDQYLEKYLSKENQETNEITKDEIIQQFITLFFTGTDTTAHLVALVLYYLGEYQEAQQEILEEMIKITNSKPIEQSQLKQFKLLQAFINECFRVRSPVPGIQLRQIKQDQYFNDIFIKKNTFISYQPTCIYYNQKYFDEPFKFNYKRWVDNNPVLDKQLAPFIFAPFSAGGRNCIGQHLAQIEATIILSHLVQKFHISLDQEKKEKVTWGFKALYSFQPEDVIKLKKRN